ISAARSNRRSVTRNRNRSPVMMRLRLQMLAPVSVRCSWNRRISSAVAVSGERFKYAANRSQRLRRRRDGRAKIVPYKKLLAGTAHRGGRLLQLSNVNNHKTEQKIFITKINYTSARSRGHSILSVVSVFSPVEKNE